MVIYSIVSHLFLEAGTKPAYILLFCLIVTRGTIKLTFNTYLDSILRDTLSIVLEWGGNPDYC